MLMKVVSVAAAAGLLVAAPVAVAQTAPQHGAYYLCVQPHRTVTTWDGKVKRQIWCKNVPSAHLTQRGSSR